MRHSSFILLFLLACGTAKATGTVEFFLDSEDCNLYQRGYVTIKNPIIFQGRPWQVDPMAGCTVAIEKKAFEQKFQFCYLSGVSVDGGGHGSCRVSQYEKENVYRFEISPAGRNPALTCSFTCVNK